MTRSTVEALGVTYKHCSPYHPQTCGKVERFHQTLKRYLAKQRPAAIAELQAQRDRFATCYDTRRAARHSMIEALRCCGRSESGLG